MKNILLTTVPHTGTRFFIKMLEQQYFKSRHHIMRSHTEPKPLRLHKFATAHTEYFDLVIEYVEKFDPIVIACERDYEAVMSSYRKRKGDEAQAHYDKNFEGWQKILEKVTPHVILSVDADDRQDRLDDLSSLLGVDLDPQGWGKVGSWEDKNRGRGRNWSI